MENAPARQPRVSPAAPRASRAWVTPACLVGAVVIAGAVMFPPFAADTLFPRRQVAAPSGAALATEAAPEEPGRSNAAVAETGDKPEGDAAATDRNRPLAAEPANEPPHNTAAEASPSTASPSTASPSTASPSTASPAEASPTQASVAESAPSATSPGPVQVTGKFETGVFAARLAPEPAAAADPSTGLAAPPIPPLDIPKAAPAEAAPAISPPPAPRAPLPLQTDLLPTEPSGPPPASKPGPDSRG